MGDAVTGALVTAAVGTAVRTAIESVPGVAPAMRVAEGITGTSVVGRIGVSMIASTASRVVCSTAVMTGSAVVAAGGMALGMVWNGPRPALTYATTGDTEALKAWIKANPTAHMNTETDSDGSPILCVAIRNRRWPMAKYLVEECGVDVNIRNERNGRMPMHAAVAAGDMSTIKLLLDKGAHKNAKDLDGNTPLRFAASDELKAELKALGLRFV